MDNKIVFGEKLSSYSFYTDILGKFYNIYSYKKDEAPILDMNNTKYIMPSAVPVLLSFGDYLNRLYKAPIQIIFAKGSDLHNFFVSSKFYEITKELGIFLWSEDVMCEWKYKKLRDLHKISYTNTNYSDADKIKNLVQKRDYIYDCLLDKSKVIYTNILEDTNRLPTNIIWATINAVAEIETNAIMYSNSHSFTYVASDRYGTNISVADSGIGFEKSFKEAGRAFKMLDLYSNLNKKFRNYLVIMSILNYSFEKHFKDNREDLWTLRTNVIKNNGIFKIQFENTQVIFSCNRCKNCKRIDNKKDISACVSCLYDKYSNDSYSPIKIFNISFQGVRIEIVINREE